MVLIVLIMVACLIIEIYAIKDAILMLNQHLESINEYHFQEDYYYHRQLIKEIAHLIIILLLFSFITTKIINIYK